ncbi:MULTISPECIES: hypothetical protein [Bacillus amyloliquefaciens group]|nr:hypothetical protein [Bacillus amyloliquefaciens]AEB26040.1 hypothetical protein BAMTA208_19460 [Bacillus amyloliquefaciens TA208]ARW41038.1 hypothetical protein S101267_03980 [Bacillus amyloliquefaciens]AZV91181.1 hypothetical protein BUN12_2929 [Bacillus amyloliquefaciens]MEC1248166.1 hypothetical protein [Bacillus amyloliquefaciens]MEC1840684.1 hypothetical protein [Bacillus amyloliquefaciens]
MILAKTIVRMYHGRKSAGAAESKRTGRKREPFIPLLPQETA